jgi:hypothetical protein
MSASTPTTFTIDCDTCVMRRTRACDDCVVTFLLERPAGTAVVLDLAEARAVRLLAEAGLVPPSRHAPVAGGCGG